MKEMIVKRDIYNMEVQKLNEFGLQKQVGLYLIKYGADGKHYKAKIEWEEVTPHLSIEPTIVENVGMVEKSSLEEAIERVAIPKVVDPLEGKLEATEKHLEDMRKLVFEEQTITHINKEMP